MLKEKLALMALPVENLNPEFLQKAASQACGLLRVLANPDRLLLLCQMCQGEYCVSDLEELTGIRQPTLSQQLTVLRDEEMVSTRREGKQIYYIITSKEALAVMQVLYQLYCKDRQNRGKK
jgi:DNA-binding transcriptional ArsR family regulator